MAECGTDGRRSSGKTTWVHPAVQDLHAPFAPSRGRKGAKARHTREALISILRNEGKTWPEVALTMGLSPSRVRAIHSRSRSVATINEATDQDETLFRP
jgi:hypothetical protein